MYTDNVCKMFNESRFCITITILLQGSFCTVVAHKKET